MLLQTATDKGWSGWRFLQLFGLSRTIQVEGRKGGVMRARLLILLAATLLVHPLFAVVAVADEGGQTATTAVASPPVAQMLVREGDFAIKLSAVLDLGTPDTEAVAEDLLVRAGVAPVNGWLSDYPMTPQILGQLQESISRAASEGNLPMTSEQGVQELYAVAAQFGLPIPAGEGPTSSEQAAPAEEQQGPDQAAISGYYYDVGPPIVTYYPPPYAYAYLYDWVPYPVWWFGVWFPGYYICHDFSTVIIYQTRTVIVSNHFVDRHRGVAVTVDPRGQPGRHGGRPRTILRAEDGRRFLTFADLRNDLHVVGPSNDNRHRSHGTGTRGGSTGHSWTDEQRRSARSIYSHRLPVPNSTQGTVRSGAGERGPRSFARPAGPAERSRRVPERTWTGPATRSYAPPAVSQRSPTRRAYSSGAVDDSILSMPTAAHGAYSHRQGGQRGEVGRIPNGEGRRSDWSPNRDHGGAERRYHGNTCGGRC